MLYRQMEAAPLSGSVANAGGEGLAPRYYQSVGERVLVDSDADELGIEGELRRPVERHQVPLVAGA